MFSTHAWDFAIVLRACAAATAWAPALTDPADSARTGSAHMPSDLIRGEPAPVISVTQQVNRQVDRSREVSTKKSSSSKRQRHNVSVQYFSSAQPALLSPTARETWQAPSPLSSSSHCPGPARCSSRDGPPLCAPRAAASPARRCACCRPAVRWIHPPRLQAASGELLGRRHRPRRSAACCCCAPQPPPWLCVYDCGWHASFACVSVSSLARCSGAHVLPVPRRPPLCPLAPHRGWRAFPLRCCVSIPACYWAKCLLL